MLYLIAYRIEGDAAAYYARLTGELERRFGIENLARRIPAHVTLKPPFKTGDIAPVLAKLEEVARRTIAVPLTLSGFETFRQKTVYLDVAMSPELQQVGTDLASEFSELVDGRGVPLPIKMHVSVARKLAPGLYKRIMQYLEGVPAPHHEMSFDNVTLFRHTGVKWVMERAFPLAPR